MSGAARIPGALESTCASPCGNTIRSPSARRIGSFPTACPQQPPRAIKWYSITRWAPGITFPAISRDGGASATQGELSSKSKYTEPVSLTARSTSESTSTFTRILQDGRACGPDGRPRRPHFRTNRERNRTLAHAIDPAQSVTPDMSHAGCGTHRKDKFMTTTVSCDPTVIRQQSTLGVAQGQRAQALADRLERGARALASLASTLADQEWQTRLPGDGRKVGVVVHHVATVYPLE